MKNRSKWLCTLWATLMLGGTAAQAATITLPGVAVEGTITYESHYTEYGSETQVTGVSYRRGSLFGENGFRYDHYEIWGRRGGYYEASLWVTYDLLPVESVSVKLSNVLLPSAGSGSLAVDIGEDRYIIPVTAYVSYSTGSRTEIFGPGYVSHSQWLNTNYSAIPEPATFGMAGSCLAGLLLHAWRRRRGLTGRK